MIRGGYRIKRKTNTYNDKSNKAALKRIRVQTTKNTPYKKK